MYRYNIRKNTSNFYGSLLWVTHQFTPLQKYIYIHWASRCRYGINVLTYKNTPKISESRHPQILPDQKKWIDITPWWLLMSNHFEMNVNTDVKIGLKIHKIITVFLYSYIPSYRDTCWIQRIIVHYLRHILTVA